jgi:hypothetical protein
MTRPNENVYKYYREKPNAKMDGNVTISGCPVWYLSERHGVIVGCFYLVWAG